MKKSFTLIAALAAAFAVNAQIEYGTIDQEALGLTGDAAPMDEGTVLCETSSVVMKLAYTDDVKTQSNKINDCTYGWVNGEAFYVDKAMTGSTNPQGCHLITPLNEDATSAPTSGFVFQFDVAKTGYLVCFSKLSSNKNYWVFEGLAGQDEHCVAYTAGIVWDDGDGVKTHLIQMPADDMGYVDTEAADADKYINLETGATRQLRQIITGDPDTALTGNGFGFIAFPVYEEVSYLMCAQGSKMTCNGFVFIPSDDAEDATLAYPTGLGAGTADAQLYTWIGESGIANVVVDSSVNSQLYNVLGQPVDNGYKGLVIKNGQKYFNR